MNPLEGLKVCKAMIPVIADSFTRCLQSAVARRYILTYSQRSRGCVKTITLGHGIRVTDEFFRKPRGHGPHGPRVGYVCFWKFFLQEASLGAALASEIPPSFPMYVH